MRQALLLPLMLLPQAALAIEPGLSCSEMSLQIQCSDGTCTAEKDFTPMAINLHGKDLSICAYSGCWEGEAVIHQDEIGFAVLGKNLAWNGDAANKANFQLAISLPSLEGMVLGEGFASPLQCEMGKTGGDLENPTVKEKAQ